MNERISINPDICSGRPVIKGTRVPVAQIVSAIAGGDTIVGNSTTRTENGHKH